MSPLRRSARVAGHAKRAAPEDAAPAKKTKTAKNDSTQPATKKTAEATANKVDAKDDNKVDGVDAKDDNKVKQTGEIEVGDAIPDLTLVDENGNDVSLVAAAKSNKYVVIFAYPKASTPGCTRQAKGFQKNYDELAKLDAAVYGLLADSPKSQLNFVTKQGLQYHLLSDPGRALIGALGARKSPTGIKRSHWVFADGKLAVKRVQISPETSIDGALAEVQKLAKGE